MQGTGLFLLGYTILGGAVVAALWKTGLLASAGPFWTGVGVAVAIGCGIMIAVSRGQKSSNIEIKR